MIEQELQIISRLTGVDSNKIRFSDAGFLSRGYVIDDGRIVFKFKKSPEVSYKNEILMLDFVNTLNLGVNLQKVGWKSEDDSFLGVYGVVGKSLESFEIPENQYEDYGQQIGLFLKRLHSADFSNADTLSIENEIQAWRNRFENSKDVLAQFFTDDEIEKMNRFVNISMPKELGVLGEKMVLSHGDLGMGNIFVDDNGKVGIIDFSESIYLDEAADFMDIEDDKLCNLVLDSYGADDILRKKATIRRSVRPMFVIGTYRNRPEKEIAKFVDKIREWLKD